jgi:hypothetical protein
MLEDLLAPRQFSHWQSGLLNTVALLGVVLFLVSSSVAFLREAKAVRVARQALDTGRPALTGAILDPFLESHPSHEEALYLAAVGKARTGDLDEAAIHRRRLKQTVPQRLGELDPEIGRAIDQAVLARNCNSGSLLDYYDSAGALGEDFHSRVLANLQQAVRRCQDLKQERHADALMAGLVERGAGQSLIVETYLDPLRQALAGDRYREAEQLARGAARFSPETGNRVSELLANVREDVEASLQKVAAACQAIRSDPSNRVGRFWCFPQAPPKSVTDARDAWGQPLRYNSLRLDPNLQCYQGFEVTSHGADGVETPDATGRPDTDLVCRFDGRRETWQAPGEFWRVQD